MTPDGLLLQKLFWNFPVISSSKSRPFLLKGKLLCLNT